MFGDIMPAIKIEFYDDSDIPNNHWIYNEARSYCTVLTKIRICRGHDFDLAGILTQQTAQVLTFLHLDEVDMLHESWANRVYPKLINFHAESIDFGANELDTLFENNVQITELHLTSIDFDFDMLDHLKRLKPPYIKDGDVTFEEGHLELASLEKCVLKLLQ